ncbi:MAG: LEPR-XLL domain-containing protein, partial [Planctomycetales bacterium]|nr:LEPR-XLL domain-containing protein [Planctomycetales bacterium]
MADDQTKKSWWKSLLQGADKPTPATPAREDEAELYITDLEPRILMSATWIDPTTGATIVSETSEGDYFEGSSG